MKILILLTLIAFIALTKANEAEADAQKMPLRDLCPTRRNCKTIKIVCPQGTVFDSNPKGCCCRPLCTGQNEIYTCGCSDLVCNKKPILCRGCDYGCFCKPGFVRHPISKKCISPKNCPVKMEMAEDAVV
ncbi:unnamed protein product [Chironomus riparius]|uniref:TIL domain-containing protein n=1 Tax=Chironomus riparius TaxID=315576 RepID=A0A9N9RKA1_9DIPT|nr:unnamed protein product [Chironomus riparius]